MSFTSALPANLPKLQIIMPIRSSLDVASGYEYATSLVKMLADSAVAYDVYTPIRRYADYGVGYDTYKQVETLTRLKELDVTEGLEYLTRTVRVSDSPVALLEVVGRVDKQLPAEVARAAELLARTATTSDFGVGRYAVPRRQFSTKELAIAHDEYDVARRYDVVAYGRELFSVGYPVSETPIQDLENAYRRASQQLSTLQHGRYAYAQDWNVLADYAKSLINILVDQFKKLYEKGYTHYVDPYDKVLECHRILSTYKYLRTGDVIMPERTNTLIDVAKCLDEVTGSVIDPATGWLPHPWEVVLVDTDDWDTAKRYVSDGTFIFVNYGTQSMTPEEVRKIVNTMGVVFVVLIDQQPSYGADTGAFYGVFYRNKNPIKCDTHIALIEYDEENQRWITRPTLDDIVHARDKVRHARPLGGSGCFYAYAKYNAGIIVEEPYDYMWIGVDFLATEINVIVNMILGQLGYDIATQKSRKLVRIVWMASYTSSVPGSHKCYPADQCLEELAYKIGWRLVDLRKR